MPQQSVSISTSTIVRVLVVGILFWVAYIVRSVLLLVFISLVFATIMHPLAEWGQRRKIPRGVSVFAVYIVAAALLIGVSLALVPLLSTEVSQIQDNFLNYWNHAISLFPPGVATYIKEWTAHNIADVSNIAKSGLTTTLSGILSTVEGVFGALGSILVVLVLTYYMVAEQNAMRRMLANFVPKHNQRVMERMINNIERRLGGWARGQLLLSIVIGLMVLIALLIIGVPYPFALALLAGLLESVPYMGPLIAGIFGVFFALTVSPALAIITAVAYYIIQVLENHFVVPKIMQRAAGISPVVSVIAILLCYELLGVIGVFIGIPIAALIIAVVESLETRTE